MNNLKKSVQLFKYNKFNEAEELLKTIPSIELAQFVKQIESECLSQVLIYNHMLIQSLINNGEFSNQDLYSYINTLALFDNIKIQTSQLPFSPASPINMDLEEFKINCSELLFSINNFEQIIHFFRFFGSNYVIHWGKYLNQFELILGEGDYEKIDHLNVYFLHKEFVFSPSVIIAMAAMINKQTIIIRKEAINKIVRIKWDTHSVFPIDNHNLEAACSLKIKQNVLQTIKHNEPLELIEELVSHNVLMHELGHAVIQHHLLPMKWAALAESFSMIKGSIIEVILEILADFAPRKHNLCGILLSLVELSKSDQLRAEQCFWVYFADTWFYDTDLKSMYTYSDIIIVLLSRYISKNQTTVNFTKIAADWDFDNPNSLATKIIDFLLDALAEFTQKFDFNIEFIDIKEDAEEQKVESYETYVDLSNKALAQYLIMNEGKVDQFLENKKIDFFSNILNSDNIISFTNDEKTNSKKIVKWFKQYFGL